MPVSAAPRWRLLFGLLASHGTRIIATIVLLAALFLPPSLAESVQGDRRSSVSKCGQAGGGTMKYAWGDALSVLNGGEACDGPDGQRYPRDLVEKLVNSAWGSVGRQARNARMQQFGVQNPEITRDLLLRYHNKPIDSFPPLKKASGNRQGRATVIRDDPAKNTGNNEISGDGKSPSSSTSLDQQQYDNVELLAQQAAAAAECASQSGRPPARLCRTKYNTTAPMFGVSLTSGRTVTIVQKFPDLLQQVVFEVCESSECDILHGECVQTYVPYLFLVIPLGPVTLTGQDYVLVESGCVCRPKYGVHVPQSLDAYFHPPLPTTAGETNSTANKSLL